MRTTIKTLMTALLAFSLSALVLSCKKGPAEKVGEKIDNAVQDTKDAAQDATDNLKKKN